MKSTLQIDNKIRLSLLVAENLFQGLAVWEEEKYRKLQGTYPVISISFASIKENDFIQTRRKICQNLTNLYSKYRFLIEQGILDAQELLFFQSVSADMDDMTATMALHQLSLYLSHYYGKNVMIGEVAGQAEK